MSNNDWLQIKKNYLSEVDLKKLQEYVRTTDDWLETPNDPLWSKRAIHSQTMNNKEIKDVMFSLGSSIISDIAHHYNVEKKLEPDVLALIRKFPAASEPSHSDSTGNSGEDNGTSHRAYSALLYLNDDFDGGELLFHNQNVLLKPEPNMAVFFPSTFEYVHSVQELRSGIRYNVTMFFQYEGSIRGKRNN